MSATSRSVGFDGMERLIADLTTFDEKVVEKTLLPAMMQGASEAAEIARANAPVRSGRLRDSIKVKNGRVTKRSVVVPLSIGVFYGKWVEYGGPHNRALMILNGAVDTVEPRLAELMYGNVAHFMSELNL